MSAFKYIKEEEKYFESILKDLEKIGKHIYSTADIPEEIKKLDTEKKTKFLGYLFSYAQKHGAEKSYKSNVTSLIDNIPKSNLKLSDDDLILFHSKMDKLNKVGKFYILFEEAVLKQIEYMYKGKDVAETVKDILLKVKNSFHSYDKKAVMKFNDRVDSLIIFKEGLKDKVMLAKFPDDNDRFSIYANDKIDTLPYEKRVVWYKLISEFKKCSGSKPTKKFNDFTFKLIEEYGKEDFKNFSIDLINFINALKVLKGSRTVDYGNGRTYTYDEYIFVSSVNTETIKGLVWSFTSILDTETINAVTKLTEKCYEKIPGKGPASAGIGNACLYTLTQAEGFEGVSALSRLRLRIKQKNTQSTIEKYLDEAAKLRNITVDDLEDISVPDFGLTIEFLM